MGLFAVYIIWAGIAPPLATLGTGVALGLCAALREDATLTAAGAVLHPPISLPDVPAAGGAGSLWWFVWGGACMPKDLSANNSLSALPSNASLALLRGATPNPPSA